MVTITLLLPSHGHFHHSSWLCMILSSVCCRSEVWPCQRTWRTDKLMKLRPHSWLAQGSLQEIKWHQCKSLAKLQSHCHLRHLIQLSSYMLSHSHWLCTRTTEVAMPANQPEPEQDPGQETSSPEEKGPCWLTGWAAKCLVTNSKQRQQHRPQRQLNREEQEIPAPSWKMIHDEGLDEVAETFGCSLWHRTQVHPDIIYFSPTNLVKGRANPSTGSGYKSHSWARPCASCSLLVWFGILFVVGTGRAWFRQYICF